MGFVVIFFLYAHTYWCYSSIVRSLTLFNCKSCSYTCTHTLHTFLISVCVCVYFVCVCIFISFGRRMKEHLGCYIELECRLSYMNFIVTMTFPFNFIAHRYFDAHLIVGTDNLRGKEQSIRSIYYVYGVWCGACGSVCYLALLALLVMFYALHNLIVL